MTPYLSELNPQATPYSAPLLERVYQQNTNTHFSNWLREFLVHSPWQQLDFENNSVKSLCLDLADEVYQYNRALNQEPAFHNLSHFTDVCLSMSILLSQREQVNQSKATSSAWHLSEQDAWLLLFCAIGHDFGHNGEMNHVPFEIEKKSTELIRLFLTRKLGQHDAELMMQKIEPIVWSTDPKDYPNLYRRIQGAGQYPQKNDCLAALLVESDLMGSILPKRGEDLGLRLAKEWSIHSPVASKNVANSAGRLQFLKIVHFLSPHSCLVGMDLILADSISQLA